jgi:hypothetical protein
MHERVQRIRGVPEARIVHRVADRVAVEVEGLTVDLRSRTANLCPQDALAEALPHRPVIGAERGHYDVDHDAAAVEAPGWHGCPISRRSPTASA